MAKVYAGASTLLSPGAGFDLGRGWGWMPKVDGVYASLETDSDGRVAVIRRRRGGKPYMPGDIADLIGLPTGLPDAVLHGELEAQTEWGRQSRDSRGYPNVHLFDVSQIAGAPVVSLPYSERYEALHRWQSAAECYETVPRCIPMVMDRRTFTWALPSDGRYIKPRTRLLNEHGMLPGKAPHDLRRLPIVPMVRSKSAAEQLWHDSVEIAGGEGLVAVRLDARLGARKAKLKLKKQDSLDCLVLSLDTTSALLSWRGHVFACPASGWIKRGLKVGDCCSVTADGFYAADVVPRFPRISSIRHDKVAA